MKYPSVFLARTTYKTYCVMIGYLSLSKFKFDRFHFL
jgi:hypothetical protein